MIINSNRRSTIYNQIYILIYYPIGIKSNPIIIKDTNKKES